MSTQSASASGPPPSPLMLADRLLSLAEEADRAGLIQTASRLVRLALAVMEERPIRRVPAA